jgi:DNA polymerase-3 subunit gamma/tau
MLKALEDTPKHVFFILATTEKEKIIKTVQTRCTQFKVESLDDKQIEQLVKWILKEEQRKDISKEIIDEIINASEGCPREAVKILDQIFDLPADKMLEAIQQTEVEREVRDLCQAMLKGQDWNQLRQIISKMPNIDAEKDRQAVIHYMKAVALKSPASAGRAALIFDCFRETFFYTGTAGLAFAAYNTTL